jgi:ADP-heptose:LPS heptosyltransferase
MVTSDSGPAHFASVADLKTFVFYGPETPRLYGSLSKNSTSIHAGLACSPCVSAYNQRSSACHDNVCMWTISSDEVFALITRYLDGMEA